MRGSKRERQPGVWELRVSLGRDARTRRLRQISRTFHGTTRQADKALARLVTEVDQGRHRGTGVTVANQLDRWLNLSAPDLSPTTLREYRRLVDRRLVPVFGDVPLTKLTASELTDHYQALRNGGLSPSSVRRIHAVLRKALNLAVQEELLDRNPALAATLPRIQRREIRPPDSFDVLRLIATAEADDAGFGTLLRIAAITGARRGEVCALRWTDIDSAGQLLIQRAAIDAPDGAAIKDTKTHASRRIAIDPSTIAALESHRRRAAEICNELGADLGPFVFSDEPDHSSPLRPNRLTDRFRSLCTRTGLPGVRLHDLRHFAVTQLLAAGMDVRTVAGRVGHANTATTLNIYGHWMDAQDQQAATILGDLLG